MDYDDILMKNLKVAVKWIKHNLTFGKINGTSFFASVLDMHVFQNNLARDCMFHALIFTKKYDKSIYSWTVKQKSECFCKDKFLFSPKSQTR